MQPMERRVQVRTRLLEGRVPQHVLDVMYRPTAFDQSGPALVAKGVEVKIDRPVRRLRFRTQVAAAFLVRTLLPCPNPARRVPVSVQHGGLPGSPDASDRAAHLVSA